MKQTKTVAQFDIKDLLPIALSIGVTAIATAYMIQVTAETGDEIGDQDCAGYWNTLTDVCQVSEANTSVLSTNSAAFNGSADGVTAVAKIPTKLSLIVTVVLAAVVIGILLRYLVFR